MKKVARMSALPVLQYCGKSQEIGAGIGAGRAAAIGTAFHAVCSKHPDVDKILWRLTASEREEVEALIPPEPSEFAGVLLKYEDALKEYAMGLDANGLPCDYGSAEAILQGTMDLGWVVDCEVGKVAVVGDIKKTSYAAPDGPNSLQVIGYAINLARKHNCDGYVTGIWDATAGEWWWGDYVDMWSDTASIHWEVVKAAVANNGGEFSIGTHCNGCYSRSRCPQFLLPLELSESSLAPFTKEGALDRDSAIAALVMAERVATTAEEVKKLVKSYARDNGGLYDPVRDKVYKPCKTKGRTSLDRKQFEQDNPELAARYTKFGTDYDTFRWVNKK